MKKTRPRVQPELHALFDPPDLTREDFERMLGGKQRGRIIAGSLEQGDVTALLLR
jgi:hypothetical protein